MHSAIKGVSRWLRMGYGAPLLLAVSCTFQSEPEGTSGVPDSKRPAEPSFDQGTELHFQNSPPSEGPVSDACADSPSRETCCEADQLVTLGTPRRDHFVFGRDHHSHHRHGEKDRCVLTFGSDDTVHTGRGDDLIHGGEGRDHLQGDGGDDVIIGGGGSDHIDAGSGNDTVEAGPGNDKVEGGHGDDELDGGTGDDELNGGDGNDTLRPGPGKDRVLGGRGDDTVTIFDTCEVERRELLQGGPGNDTLITPVSVAELQALGVTVLGFENIVIESGSCQSECADVPDCSNRGTCVDGDSPGETSCDCDAGFSGDNCQFASVTAEAGGLAYIEQCNENDVPQPPVWNYEDAFHGVNGTQWVNDGPLVWPFISEDLVAEAFIYESTDPPGVCVALPRSVMDANGIPVPGGITLLGVICQGTESSKACFWDSKNVDRFDTMNFTEDCQIVGTFPNTSYLNGAGENCFIGGTDLASPNATGGTCTNCHRGENVFLIPNPFPEVDSGLTAALPRRMPAAWHDPIVDATWPDNPGPMVFTAMPDSCLACHNEAAAGSPTFGGRLPSLSVAPGDYCRSVGRTVFDLTMPVGARQICETAADCPMGNVCEVGNEPIAMVCKQPCAMNADCPAGYVCDGTLRCALDIDDYPSYQELLGFCPP